MQEFTSVERRMMVLAEDDGRSKEEVEEAENKAKAVIAAKTGNLSVSHCGRRSFVNRTLLWKSNLSLAIIVLRLLPPDWRKTLVLLMIGTCRPGLVGPSTYHATLDA